MRELTDRERLVRSAWAAAAADLGITFDSETAVPCAHCVWVQSFGSPNGTICGLADSPDRSELEAWARERGVFCSLLTDGYSTYDRELFVETLDDWGWHASWYSGAPWTSA